MLASDFRCRRYSQTFPKGLTGLHLASLLGLKYVVNDLPMDSAEPDVTDGANQTPPIWALRNGHCEVVERLLDANASANVTADRWAALQIAAGGRHL